ncbi:MAG: hypothetical protein Q9203_006313 [Teloschistes exilis]
MDPEFEFEENDFSRMAQIATQPLYEGVQNHGDVYLGQNAEQFSGVPVALVQGGNMIYPNLADDTETPGAVSEETLEAAQTEENSSDVFFQPALTPDPFAPVAFNPAEHQQFHAGPTGAVLAYVSDRPFLGLGPSEFIEVGQFTGYWDPTQNLMTFVPFPGQGSMQQPIQHYFAGPINHGQAPYPSTACQAPETYQAYPPPPPPPQQQQQQQQQHQQFAAPGFSAPPHDPTPYDHQQQGYPSPPRASSTAPYPGILALVNGVVAGRGSAAGDEGGDRAGEDAAGEEAEMDGEEYPPRGDLID